MHIRITKLEFVFGNYSAEFLQKKLYKQLVNRKSDAAFGTDRTQVTFGPHQLSKSPVVFDVSEKSRAVSHSDLALIRQLPCRSRIVWSYQRDAGVKVHFAVSLVEPLPGRTTVGIKRCTITTVLIDCYRNTTVVSTFGLHSGCCFLRKLYKIISCTVPPAGIIGRTCS